MTSHIYCGGKPSPDEVDNAIVAEVVGIWMTDSDLVEGAIAEEEKNLLREEPGSESNALSLEQWRCC